MRRAHFAFTGHPGQDKAWPVSAIRSTEKEGLEETVLHRLGDGGGARRDIEFIQDVGDMPVDRVLAEIERCRGLFVTQPLCQETKNLPLPSRQTCGCGHVPAALRCAGFETTQNRRDPLAFPNRADLLQNGECCLGFPHGGIGAVHSGEHAGELPARARGVIWRPSFVEEINRILEPASRFFVVCAGGRHDAFGKTSDRPQCGRGNSARASNSNPSMRSTRSPAGTPRRKRSAKSIAVVESPWSRASAARPIQANLLPRARSGWVSSRSSNACASSTRP